MKSIILQAEAGTFIGCTIQQWAEMCLTSMGATSRRIGMGDISYSNAASGAIFTIGPFIIKHSCRAAARGLMRSSAYSSNSALGRDKCHAFGINVKNLP